jgi:hypothetical protein
MRALATIAVAAGLLAAATASAPAFTPPIGTDKGSLTDRNVPRPPPDQGDFADGA